MGDSGAPGPDRGQFAILFFLFAGMQDFAGRLIAAAQRGEKLDEGTLSRLREACIIAAKNSETFGFRMEDDAKIIGQSAEALDNLLQSTIAWGRKRDD